VDFLQLNIFVKWLTDLVVTRMQSQQLWRSYACTNSIHVWKLHYLYNSSKMCQATVQYWFISRAPLSCIHL